MVAVNEETKGNPPDYLEVLRRVKTALDRGHFPRFNVKPLQLNVLSTFSRVKTSLRCYLLVLGSH